VARKRTVWGIERVPRPKPKLKRKGKGTRGRRLTDRDRADEVWRKVILALHPRCVTGCGYPATDAHHIISRGNHNTRHRIENGLGLCRSCHRHAHDYPSSFREWLELKLPDHYQWYMQNKQYRFERVDFEANYLRLVDIYNLLTTNELDAYWVNGEIVFE